MDVKNNRRMHRLITSACLRWAFMSLLLLPWLKAAATQIIVVGEEDNSVHSRFLDGFERQIADSGKAVSITFLPRKKVANSSGGLGSASMVVTLGGMAARDIESMAAEVPTINALINKDHRREIATGSERFGKTSAIYVDQPPRRILSLVKAALAGAETLTIATGENTQRIGVEMTEACETLQLVCEIVLISGGAGIEKAMEKAVLSDHVLVVPPDPSVINAATAKTLILGAYRRRISLVGYSQALVKAGALMAVHSTPEQLGVDTANMALNALSRSPVKLPASRYPALFSVSVNYQLARALRLNLPSQSLLERTIQKAETHE